VTGCRFGNGVILIRIQKNSATSQETSEAAAQLVLVKREVIGAQLVHRH
jgi:hypothetical protein